MSIVIKTLKIFNDTVISGGGFAESDPLLLEGITGYFSVQNTITGDGTLKLEYLLSLDGINYLEPSEASDITTGQTKISGPGGDGKDIISFSPILASYIKIKATETTGINSATLTSYLAAY